MARVVSRVETKRWDRTCIRVHCRIHPSPGKEPLKGALERHGFAGCQYNRDYQLSHALFGGFDPFVIYGHFIRIIAISGGSHVDDRYSSVRMAKFELHVKIGQVITGTVGHGSGKHKVTAIPIFNANSVETMAAPLFVRPNSFRVASVFILHAASQFNIRVCGDGSLGVLDR